MVSAMLNTAATLNAKEPSKRALKAQAHVRSLLTKWNVTSLLSVRPAAVVKNDSTSSSSLAPGKKQRAAATKARKARRKPAFTKQGRVWTWPDAIGLCAAAQLTPHAEAEAYWYEQAKLEVGPKSRKIKLADGRVPQLNDIRNGDTSGVQMTEEQKIAVNAHRRKVAHVPEMLAQWDHERNGTLTPHDVSFQSTKMVHWICPRTNCTENCVHYIYDSPNRRHGLMSGKTACRLCSSKEVCEHNSLQMLRPDLAAELIETDDIKSLTLSLQSNKVVQWKCDARHEECECDQLHIWSAMVQNRTKNGTGCPFCQGRNVCKCRSFGTAFPEFAAQMDPSVEQPDPYSLPRYSNDPLQWLCPTHGPWITVISNRTAQGKGCPRCIVSIMERDAATILTDMGFEIETQFQFEGSVYKYDILVQSNEAFGTPEYLVELDGRQHFSPSSFGSKTIGVAEKNFADTKRNDAIKETLALQNVVSLLRIPYTRAKLSYMNQKQCFMKQDIEQFLELIRSSEDALVCKVDQELYDKRDNV